MFGKPGRPPEDRVARRREIWIAVAPLIERVGARQLSMRRAAEAAHLSLGGLYHYFSSKQDLVLYGMTQEALERGCAEFLAQHGHLRETDPDTMVEAFIRFFAGEAAFIRPAIKAALVLGTDEVLPRLGELVNIGLGNFTATLRLALPRAPEEELRALALATRRLFFASLVDWTLTQDEFAKELGALVEAVRARQATDAGQPLGTPMFSSARASGNGGSSVPSGIGAVDRAE